MNDVQELLLAAEVLKLAEKLRDEEARTVIPDTFGDARSTADQRKLWRAAHPVGGFLEPAMRVLKDVAATVNLT